MKRWQIILLVSIIVIAGVGFYLYKQGMALLNYCFNIDWKKTKVNKISKDGLDVVLGIDIKNNSDITINVTGYKFDILVNGKKVGQVVNKDDFKWLPKSLSTLYVKVIVDFKELVKNKVLSGDLIAKLLLDQSKVIITIKGDVSVGLFGVNLKNYPVEVSSSLADYMAPSTNPEAETVCK
jgi:LEA14-like dessication related protein